MTAGLPPSRRAHTDCCRLTNRERRQLARIERQLRADDPQLAERPGAPPIGRAGRRRLPRCDLPTLLIAGLLTLVLGAIGSITTVGIAGMVLSLGALCLAAFTTGDR
jgi:hypothetical protein